MAALKHAIFLTVIAVIAVIAAGIVMWLFAAFYGAAIGTWQPNTARLVATEADGAESAIVGLRRRRGRKWSAVRSRGYWVQVPFDVRRRRVKAETWTGQWLVTPPRRRA
jgi:hypothetical protein